MSSVERDNSPSKKILVDLMMHNQGRQHRRVPDFEMGSTVKNEFFWGESWLNSKQPCNR
jgi:hypothetical protein